MRQYGSPKEESKENRRVATDPPKPDPSPPNKVVTDFHKNASVDTRAEDIHHTLGTSPSQAAPGSHRHDGKDSVALFEGFTVTGSRSNGTALQSLLNVLTNLGLNDSSTP